MDTKGTECMDGKANSGVEAKIVESKRGHNGI